MAVEESVIQPLSSEVERPSEYDGRLTDILRKRRRPLLLVIDEDSRLLCSSLPDEAPAVEHRLLGQALSEAKNLTQSEARLGEAVKQLIVEKPGERCALVMLEGDFYSVRLFRLYTASYQDSELDKYAALIEPIVGPLVDGVDFAKVKDTFRLSNREVDVLEALMSGSRDKEIAKALGVTAGTVRAYLKSVRAKLRVTTRAGLVNRVHELSSENSSG
jgi:DNA-binding CsgD family transcriptional regulator